MKTYFEKWKCCCGMRQWYCSAIKKKWKTRSHRVKLMSLGMILRSFHRAKNKVEHSVSMAAGWFPFGLRLLRNGIYENKLKENEKPEIEGNKINWHKFTHEFMKLRKILCVLFFSETKMHIQVILYVAFYAVSGVCPGAIAYLSEQE